MGEQGMITLITDFGTGSPYVGVMKGVAAAVNPEVTVVDITNAIARHSVMEAAITLAMSFRFFPPGTVHLVVVDPGVGTSRRAIAAQFEDFFFVAPDNGVLSVAMGKTKRAKIVELTRRDLLRNPPSATFHGRDVFAPAAAQLTLGVPLEELGAETEKIMQLALPTPEIKRGKEIAGHVIYIDDFGNAITNVTPKTLEYCFVESIPPLQVEGARAYTIFPLQKTYEDVPAGKPLAYFGSAGYLELAVNRGDASRQCLLEVGSIVTVRPKKGARE